VRASLSFSPGQVIGVDFSGAAKAGKTAWLAELDVDDGTLHLRALKSLGRWAGGDDRATVCKYLTGRILDADATLFGMDFPFGLPIELGLGGWTDQLAAVRQFDGTAKDFGRHLVDVSRSVGETMHIRRTTDRETQTPFDCYHYRIIYQTYHGMGDVLAAIADAPATAVLPFQYRRLPRCRRVVVEACPSSTLKRLNLPHRLYKQSGGKPPDKIHQTTRREILRGLPDLNFTAYQRRVMMTDPGGDALDAVIAAVGSWWAYQNRDHKTIRRHDRYPIEGCVFA